MLRGKIVLNRLFFTTIFSFLLILLFLVTLSCSTVEQKEIQSLEDIPGGIEGPQPQDIGPHSARIIFKANIPVVCNVAFGTDTSYGRLAVMAMTGPLTDHDVQLLGLEPSSTYHFKVTVTDVASNIYQSEDLTFTTIKDDGEAQPEGRNVAAAPENAEIIGVSSNWGGGGLDSSFGGNSAIDGNPTTEWSSNNDGDEAWIEIEFDQRYDLNVIGFWTRTMGNSGQISSFNVITGDGQELGIFDLPDASTIYYFEVQVQAKKLRFEVINSSGGNTGAVEIEAYSIFT
jgi:hypothetical protein